MKRGRMKLNLALLSICLLMLMTSFEVFAAYRMADNEAGNTIAEFPSINDIMKNVLDMERNSGTISYFRSKGTLNINAGTINTSDGIVQTNYGTIGVVQAGKVARNRGTIDKVTNTGVVGSNFVEGVITYNFNDMDQNHGTITHQVSGIIKENKGNIGTVYVGGEISNYTSGTINENNGKVRAVIASSMDNPEIENNKGKVEVEIVSGGPLEKRGTLTIGNNDGTVYLKEWAYCTITNNTGEIFVNENAKCKISGTNRGKITIIGFGAFCEISGINYGVVSASEGGQYLINIDKSVNDQMSADTKPDTSVNSSQVTDRKTKAAYVVTNASKKEATYVRSTDKNATMITVPATVVLNKVTYKVTKIADNAFKGNEKITQVTIGSNIRSIGKNAFSKCTALTKITIPAKVTKIGKSAFEGCKELKYVTIKSSKLEDKKVGEKVFNGISAAAKVKVPKKQLNAYKKMLKKKGITGTHQKITK